MTLNQDSIELAHRIKCLDYERLNDKSEVQIVLKEMGHTLVVILETLKELQEKNQELYRELEKIWTYKKDKD